MQLFRPEALAGQDRLHGEVVLVPQVSWRLLGLFLATALTAAAVFSCFARYADVERLEGRVEAAATAASRIEARIALPPAEAAAFEQGRFVGIAAPPGVAPFEVRIAARTAGAAIVEADRESADTLRPGATVTLLVEARPRSLADRLLERLGELR